MEIWTPIKQKCASFSFFEKKSIHFVELLVHAKAKGLNIYSFLASCNICRLLITFAKSLGPALDRQNVGPELDPNNLTLW